MPPSPPPPPPLIRAGAHQPPSSPPALWPTRALLKLRWAQCRALLRNRYDSAQLVAGTALVVALATADVVYQWAGRMPPGCDRAFFLGVGVPHSCEPAFSVSVSLTAARFAVVVPCLMWLFVQRIFYIHVRLRSRARVAAPPRGSDSAELLPVPKPSSSAGPLRSDSRVVRMKEALSNVRVWGSGSAGWAVASSEQSWREATGAVYSSVVLMLTVALGLTAILAAINAVTALTRGGWTSGRSWEYACATCSDDAGQAVGREQSVAACVGTGEAPLNMCFLAWHARLVFPYLIGGQVVSLSVLTYLAPLRLWDPIAVEAGKQTGLRWLNRLRVLHLLVLPTLAHVWLPLVAFLAMELHVGPRVLLEMTGYGSIIFGLAQLGLAAWLLWAGKQHHAQNGTTPEKRTGSVWQLVRELPSALLYESAAGLNFKLMYLLVLIIFTFCAHLGAYGAAYYFTLLTIRAIIFALFLLVRDKHVGFWELRHDPRGAGFGLVVDASRLRAALRGFLRGACCQGALPTYKATVYRMEATMTVSYRWQGVEASVCPGLSLNMSRWQMEQLVLALETTSCFYVWIDRLSVPQVESELQNTLLSRMMATYASARETLVLRSGEESGSRYHQRAWTLPEFVCSASPRTCTEGEEQGTGNPQRAWVEGGLISHTKEEEVLVAEIREHYLARMAQCRPLWLHPNRTLQLPSDLEQTWELCERALGLLHCSISEDRIRAVYPLLFNVPVDNHEELVVLVDAVACALEASAPQSAASRLARRHYYEIMEVAVIDEDEPAPEPSQDRASALSYVLQKISARVVPIFRSGRAVLPASLGQSSVRHMSIQRLRLGADRSTHRLEQRSESSSVVPLEAPHPQRPADQVELTPPKVPHARRTSVYF